MSDDHDRAEKRERRLIAVDFDNTLTTGEGARWWNNPFDEEPDEQVIELVNDLYRRGHIIHIWTARREEVRAETQMWLDRWDVMHHALVMEKHSPDAFIDDRAINANRAVETTVESIEQVAYA
jgi:hypothetical protein